MDSRDSTSESTSEPTVLDPGDARFLIARHNKLEIDTLSGNRTELLTLDENVHILDLALSPDKSRIAFTLEQPASINEQGLLEYGSDIYVSDADGSNLRPVLVHQTVGDYFELPAWLDDSTLLIGWRGFDIGGSTHRIERVNIETGERQVLREGVMLGALSPDRQTIAYFELDDQTNMQRLVIQDLEGHETPRVLVDENDGVSAFSGVTFSPDGSQVAFAAVDASTSVRPTSPVRQGVAFVTYAPLLTHPFAQDVWLVSTSDGAGPHRLAEVTESLPALTWSGDGTYLYVLGPHNLWRIEPKTPVVEKLLENTGERSSIIWLEGN